MFHNLKVQCTLKPANWLTRKEIRHKLFLEFDFVWGQTLTYFCQVFFTILIMLKTSLG